MRKNACKLSTWGYEAIYRLGYNPAGSELPSAAICLPMLLIAAAVINNQGWPGPAARIGQVLNVLSWGFALLILAPFALGRAWFRFLSYLLLAGLLLRDFTFGRTAYLIAQNTLVFFAGSLIVLRDSRLLTRQFSILAGASAILMFLQVLGVGEFTQVLATHGSLGNGVKLETTPQPTFLVSAENLQVSFIQGRPSGPLYSNQFASLVAIFAMGAFLCFGLGTRTRNFASALAISTMSVLTLAKIVILSATAMVAATLFSHDPAVKFRAKWIAGLSAVVFALYSALFPGVVQTYLGLLSISLSFYSRIFDFLFNIGADPSDDSPLSKYLRQQSTDAVGYIHANNMVFVQAPPQDQRAITDAGQPGADRDHPDSGHRYSCAYEVSITAADSKPRLDPGAWIAHVSHRGSVSEQFRLLVYARRRLRTARDRFLRDPK